MTKLSVEQIENMERDELVSLWKEMFAEPAPYRASLAFLRNVLAFEIQSRQKDGLPSNFIKQLNKHATGAKTKRSKHIPQPGGRLLREWHGTTHVVDIADDHYLWQEKPFKSLSAIAREITGAHWSGPRFFGLNEANQQ